MLITNHVLSGAVVGALSSSKRGAFLGGLVSHAILDAIPHWGARSHRHFLTVAVVDGLVGAAAMAVIAKTSGKGDRGRVVAGMLGATVPDADKPWREVFGCSPFPTAVDRVLAAIQTESPDRMGREVLVGVIGAAVTAGVLRRHVRVGGRATHR